MTSFERFKFTCAGAFFGIAVVIPFTTNNAYEWIGCGIGASIALIYTFKKSI